jgi:hypothetical protein
VATVDDWFKAASTMGPQLEAMIGITKKKKRVSLVMGLVSRLDNRMVRKRG